ncbi:MAG: hypothetical protein PHI41_05825 [Erysipelotrichaceae bacterium]|nr:hypothetical protein [Erysipelotrichaceae bacterium]MDD3809775.1 hypothetical protein [Erysipelotrichaceae bacterium]
MIKMNGRIWLSVVLAGLMLSGCKNKSGDKVYGDLARDGVEISMPQGALEDNDSLTIVKSDQAQPIKEGEAMLLGDIYDMDIAVADGIKRFYEPLTLKFEIKQEKWDKLENPQDLAIAYYDGSAWEYLIPDEIDPENKTVTFTTYHCSFLSPVEPTEEQIIDQESYNQALAQYNLMNNSQLKKTTESLVKSVMGEKVDKSLLQDIVEGMMNQNDFTQLLKAGANGNSKEFQNQFVATYTQVTANTLWAYSANLAGDLGDLGANLGLAGAFGTSAAMIGEGNYEDAAKELARGIIETHPVGKLMVNAVNVTQRQIDRWKSEEIEAAYQIYLNGKEPTIPFWGYGSIEAGDFDEIWNQMRGVGRQIIIDATADFRELNGREPTETEQNQIEKDAKNTLRDEFEQRHLKESIIKDAQKKNQEMIAIMKDLNLLTKDRYGYDPDQMTYRQRVEQLLNARNRILQDTRKKISFVGWDEGEWIDAYTVTELVSILVRDGQEAYEQALVEKGLVETFDLARAAGDYQATLTFANNNVTSTKNESETAKQGDMSRKSSRTMTRSSDFANVPVNVHLGLDGMLKISYDLTMNGNYTINNDYEYSNGESYSSVYQEVYSYTFKESFTNIKINTGINATTNLNRIIGDRYTTGQQKITEESGVVRDLVHDSGPVSCYIEKLTTRVVNRKLVINAQFDFNQYVDGVVYFDSAIPASLTLEITSPEGDS